MKQKIVKTKKDSISFWINSSKNHTLSQNIRRQFLLKAYKSITADKIDSIKLKQLSDLAYCYLKIKDNTMFKKNNNEVIALAIKIKDSFSLGDAHWNYASYYNNKQSYDSAYYYFNTAGRFFKSHKYYGAKMLIGKAYIKMQYSDYLGSEKDIVKAIKIFKKLNKYKELSICYNKLALIQNELMEYDKALFYFDKVLEYSKKAKKKTNINIFNNIALVYQKKGDYNNAIKFFKKDLKEDLRKNKPRDYARIIDNIAYTKLLNRDTLGILKDFKTSLYIRDSLQNKDGTIISSLHLAAYYAYKTDTINAIGCAEKANSLATVIKNSRDYLTSLKLLAKLDKKKAEYFLGSYIQFKDSLLNVERKTQNKFARISFETDDYIEQNKSLSQDKIQITILSLACFLILTLLYFLRIQRTKNQKLLLETEYQKANEQIYTLTLRQQSKLEQEKINERNRISEELHDGILGKLFGTRIGLGFLDFEEGKASKKKFELLLDELQVIEKEIREVSHKLNANFDDSKVNFKTIIQQLIKNKSEIAKFDFKFEVNEAINWEEISEIIKVNLYKIIQEALQNIIKYAQAKNTDFQFNIKDEYLHLLITDDGIGFNLKKTKKGIGIRNMKNRVKKLKGVFTLNSKPNQGTKIKIQIPIKKNYNEK